MERKLRKLHSSTFAYFVAVATEGSFRGAARKLRIASSAVNRHILLLEQELGFELFERGAKALKLTNAGEALLRHCQRVVRNFEDLLEELDALRDLRSGVVRIAASESFAADVVPRICSEFSDMYPAITLRVAVAESDAVIRAVEEDQGDIGFAFGEHKLRNAHLVASFRLEIGAVISPSHPLAGRRQVTIEECLKYPVVIPADRLSFRQKIDRVSPLFASGGPGGIEASSPRLMIGVARLGRHVAFQTRIGLSDEMASGSLVFVPLSDRSLEPDRCLLLSSARSTGRFAATRFAEYAALALGAMVESPAKNAS